MLFQAIVKLDKSINVINARYIAHDDDAEYCIMMQLHNHVDEDAENVVSCICDFDTNENTALAQALTNDALTILNEDNQHQDKHNANIVHYIASNEEFDI